MRFLGCYVGDLCHVRNVRKITSHTFLLQAEQGWHYNTEKYREAITNEVQCKVPLEDGWGKKPFHDKEKMRKEYHEYCPKSKLNSIVFCPKKIIKRKKDKKVQWINDYFKKFEKKIKNKHKEQNLPYSDSKLTQPLPQYTVHRTLNRVISRTFLAQFGLVCIKLPDLLSP